MAKYKGSGLDELDKSVNGEKQWNAWKNPDIDYTPECIVCLNKYNEFRRLLAEKQDKITIEFEHSNSCLWYEYFFEKILLQSGKVNIIIGKKLNVNKISKPEHNS